MPESLSDLGNSKFYFSLLDS